MDKDGKIDYDFMDSFIDAIKYKQFFLINQYLTVNGYDNTELTDDEKKLYTETTLDLIKTPYVEKVCAHEENLGRYANNDQNIYSNIDLDEKSYVKVH